MTTRDDYFAGKVALVTGGTKGIGLEVARRLVAAGSRVAVTGRSLEQLEKASREVQGLIPIEADAGDLDAAAAVVSRVAAELGPLDFLVNNAAITDAVGGLLDLPLEAADALMRTNVLGPFAYARAAWRSGMSERGGAIVNVASIAAFAGFGAMPMYGVSKAASVRLTEVLAREFGPGVRVNAVAPGVVKTDLARQLYAAHEEQVAADYPLKRLGEPTDVAQAIIFLLSGEAGWISGATLVIDGGRRQGAKR